MIWDCFGFRIRIGSRGLDLGLGLDNITLFRFLFVALPEAQLGVIFEAGVTGVTLNAFPCLNLPFLALNGQMLAFIEICTNWFNANM